MPEKLISRLGFGFVRSGLALLAILVPGAEGYTFRVLVAFTEQADAQGFGVYNATHDINYLAKKVYESSSPTYPDYQMPKVELAGTVKVSYTGSTVEPAVLALRRKTDYQMDEIHALRDWYKADIVILYHPFTDWGGWAYDIGINHGDGAFAVVSTTNVGSLTAVHEIGHLVGCVHDDHDPDLIPPPFGYGYGYRGQSNAWGTVMTYHPQRKEWFSNPYETHNGAARGIVDSADCTRLHHERKGAFSAYRTTPNAITMANVHLQENESVLWNVSGPIYFVGSSSTSSMNGGLVSLTSEQDVNFLGFPHAQIISRAGATYLKSSRTISLSGKHFYDSTLGLGWPEVYTVSDTLRFEGDTETILRSARTSLNANTIYHESGAAVTSEKDPADDYDPQLGLLFNLRMEMNARDRIRLSKNFKIKGGHALLRVSGDLDPFENKWDHILEKPSVDGNVLAGQELVFGTRVVQDKGRLLLEYSLPELGPVSVQVFDLKGRLAGSLDIRQASPGLHTAAIPGKFENGTVYFLRMVASGQVRTHRFVRGFQ